MISEDKLRLKIECPDGFNKTTRVSLGDLDITKHLKSLVLNIDASTGFPVASLSFVRLNIDADVLTLIHLNKEELAQSIAFYQEKVAPA